MKNEKLTNLNSDVKVEYRRYDISQVSNMFPKVKK